MLKLLIVRHGNTFDKGDVIRRVGAKTDLPLSKSGVKQCNTLSLYIDKNYPNIDYAYCSQLQRTKQSAKYLLKNQTEVFSNIIELKELNEMDYGIDEGKAESEVINRLGLDTLKQWDEECIVPDGWLFNPEKCQEDLVALLNKFSKIYKNKTLLLVTSNGIARFLQAILSEEEKLNITAPLKLPTASISEFTYDKINKWQCVYWGKVPTQ